MSNEVVEKQLLEIARRLYHQGPGFAQESVVLREAEKQLGPRSLADEQLILTCWQDLFQKGLLSWGYDLGNPSRPWYHFRNGESSRA
jgi:hypothetical protein